MLLYVVKKLEKIKEAIIMMNNKIVKFITPIMLLMAVLAGIMMIMPTSQVYAEVQVTDFKRKY